MSTHRDLAGWVEHRTGRRRAVAHIVSGGVVHDYPADQIELARGMGVAALAVAAAEEAR